VRWWDYDFELSRPAKGGENDLFHFVDRWWRHSPARHPPLRTKAVEQLGAVKLETQLGRGRVNSWWLKRSKVQKREFQGAPLLAMKFLDGICSDCGLPCRNCRHGHVATVSIFLEKDRGHPLAPFDAIFARSPANARARIEEEIKREDIISQVACIVYSPP
jgi:hypothetical protein